MSGTILPASSSPSAANECVNPPVRCKLKYRQTCNAAQEAPSAAQADAPPKKQYCKTALSITQADGCSSAGNCSEMVCDKAIGRKGFV